MFSQNVMLPDEWTQVALDILAQKYFRRAGVAKALKKVRENGVPEWLWRFRAAIPRRPAGESDAAR